MDDIHFRNSSKIQSTNCGERCKIDTPDTHISDRSLSWLGTGTSIKRGEG